MKENYLSGAQLGIIHCSEMFLTLRYPCYIQVRSGECLRGLCDNNFEAEKLVEDSMQEELHLDYSVDVTVVQIDGNGKIEVIDIEG